LPAQSVVPSPGAMDFDDLDEVEAERDAKEEAEREAREAEERAAEEARRQAAEARRKEEEEAARVRAKEQGEAEEEAANKPPVRQSPSWRQVQQPNIQFTEIAERANKSMPGDYYGIEFPHDKDGILKRGPQWLTQAFHKTGVLPKDNAVTKILDAKEFVGGGAGLKCIIKVEYKIDRPYLHKELFIKLPHKPNGSDRFFVSCMWNHDRPETIFNIWLEPYIPYKVPKCYFADICAETTNFILITETIPWSPKGKKEFQPGDVEPAYDKYMDWELPDGGPMYYHACCKALGKIAAYHKAGKLHPQINDMFPMPADVPPQIPKGIPGMAVPQRKEANAKIDSLVKFVSETAKAVFPAEITDKAWLETWKNQALHFLDYGIEVGCFMMGAGTPNPRDYVTLTHNNLQIDNAYFWHDDDNELQVGLLDWGVLSCAPLASAVQGCISGAEFEVLVEHREDFLETLLSSYELYGGPGLDEDRFKQMSDLQMMQWATGIISNVTQVLKHTKPKEWADVKDWMDERLLGRFQTRTHCAQFKIALQLWRKLDLYPKFLKWLEQEGLPSKKG